jgi:4-hydroxythreonine-4-phosphate dehydrogenase
MNGRIGISLGDPAGIGPEVTLKALAVELSGDAAASYLLIGDAPTCQRLNQQLALGLTLSPFTAGSTSRICLLDPGASLPETSAPESPAAARAAVDWLREAAQRCLRGELAAMVTAPVNKHAVVRAGIPFIGQTELLSEMAGTARTAMMLLGQDSGGRWLRVALVTTHLALRRVPDAITPAKLGLALDLAAQSCRDLGLSRARLAVCGLNPHAGEGGEFGREEAEVILPAITAARQRGLEAVGPLPADTVFHQALRGNFEVVVAMYHDQGLGPLKTVAFDTGVNWTLGLPFIRTSPDHGTAYDIAGRGVANPSSMIAALCLARQLVARRASLTRTPMTNDE